MQIILSLQSLYPKRVCLEQLLCVCARVCVHTITCVSMLFLWVLNFLMSIQQSIAFSLVFWLDRVLCYPPNRPHASSIAQTPRLLIDIMIFHLNLPQTILEHCSNTAKVFPFQSKRKKKKKSLTCFIISTLPSPTSHSLCSDFISYCSLSTSLLCSSHTNFFWKSKMSLSRHPCAVVFFPKMLSSYPTCFLPLFLHYVSYLTLHLHWKFCFSFVHVYSSCISYFIIYLSLAITICLPHQNIKWDIFVCIFGTVSGIK